LFQALHRPLVHSPDIRTGSANAGIAAIAATAIANRFALDFI
jgi:hypothetical protein